MPTPMPPATKPANNCSMNPWIASCKLVSLLLEHKLSVEGLIVLPHTAFAADLLQSLASSPDPQRNKPGRGLAEVRICLLTSSRDAMLMVHVFNVVRDTTIGKPVAFLLHIAHQSIVARRRIAGTVK